MDMANPRDPDRRIRRTRKAVLDALIQLIFSRRYDAIRTADLITAAGIGRSTFYEHFRSKDDVLLAVIDPIFVPLADAVTGRGSTASLIVMLDHIWEQRSFARLLFEPGLQARLQRKLAAMIEARIGDDPDGGPPVSLVAAGAAASQFGLLRPWLAGEVACPARVLADHMRQSAAARRIGTNADRDPAGPALSVARR